jgi:hypothetical protein
MGKKKTDLLSADEKLLYFSNNSSNTCIIGGTGTGKSYLIHKLLLEIKQRESDARVIDNINIMNLENVIYEIQSRRILLNKHGADSFIEYEFNTGNNLERIILVVDEYHNEIYNRLDYPRVESRLKKILRDSANVKINVIIADQNNTKIDSELMSSVDNLCVFKSTEDESMKNLLNKTKYENLQIGEFWKVHPKISRKALLAKNCCAHSSNHETKYLLISKYLSCKVCGKEIT